MNKSKVSVIILNYNGALDTIDCLISLSKCTYPNFDIIVVDNLSTDDSMNIIQKYISKNYENNIDSPKLSKVKTSCSKMTEIKLIQSGTNGGYGFGNNIGIKHALANSVDYILILNNDTIVEPDFMDPLLASAEDDPTVGIVSCKILYNHDRTKIWFNGGTYSKLTCRVEHFNFNEIDKGQRPPPKITFISGCLWLIPTKVIKKVGLINEKYFMYMEDVEYCARVQNADFSLKVIDTSKIYHKAGSASGGRLSAFSIYWKARNKVLFITNNFSIFNKIISLTDLILIQSLRWLVKGKLKLFLSHTKGIINGVFEK